MQTINAIIIEDEPLVANNLRKNLQQVDPDIQILQVLTSLNEAKQYFASHTEPDLVFMDIQLGDGVSFDLLETHPLQCPVIFTTAFDEYAIRAFQLNSIDYLLKPIDNTELTRALEKFRRWMATHPSNIRQQLQSLLTDLAPGTTESKYKDRFMVHHGKTYIPITTSEVSCFQKDEIIFCITTDGKKHVTDYDTLDKLESLLDPKVFFRANRQFIVHIDSVAHLKPHYTGKVFVTLKNPAIQVEVSREKASNFKQWLG